VQYLQGKSNELVRVEPTDTGTAGRDTNHSTAFTLLLELNVMYGQRWIAYSSNCKIVSPQLLPLMAKYTLPFSKSVKSDHN